ncbi:MAG: UDP-N-acetylmuramoyl-L-alanyl-D-glutamate--2,6-diaminopimelate ligase, partial [Candidatus Paceibacterota bacterium]
LNKIFKEMIKQNCEYVFMEVSSHAMDQNRVAGINFLGGIFSNLTQDHLDYHKNMENYFLAKKKFFKILSKDAFALSNFDDEKGKEMLDGIKARKFSYGFSGGENFHGEILKLDFSGLELKFNNEIVKSKLLGKFNAYNLLAVWSVCKLLGFDMQKVNKILENVDSPDGRFMHFMSKKGILAIVDYAHSPDSLEKILLTLREIGNKDAKIISLFGCGGERDALKRPIMGKISAQLADISIFTSDNPRSEDPEKIISEMKADLNSELSKKVLSIIDRSEAVKKAVEIAQKGDIILCAGKGQETCQQIKGQKIPYNDMEELKKNLN